MPLIGKGGKPPDGNAGRPVPCGGSGAPLGNGTPSPNRNGAAAAMAAKPERAAKVFILLVSLKVLIFLDRILLLVESDLRNERNRYQT